MQEIERALGILLSRESRRGMYERTAARAGLSLDPPACWLLFQLSPTEPTTLDRLAVRVGAPAATLEGGLTTLLRLGFVASRVDGGQKARFAVTSEGRQAIRDLLEAHRAELARLLADWSPEEHHDLANLLERLAHALAHRWAGPSSGRRR